MFKFKDETLSMNHASTMGFTPGVSGMHSVKVQGAIIEAYTHANRVDREIQRMYVGVNPTTSNLALCVQYKDTDTDTVYTKYIDFTN